MAWIDDICRCCIPKNSSMDRHNRSSHIILGMLFWLGQVILARLLVNLLMNFGFKYDIVTRVLLFFVSLYHVGVLFYFREMRGVIWSVKKSMYKKCCYEIE
jgi:hypothetical protein